MNDSNLLIEKISVINDKLSTISKEKLNVSDIYDSFIQMGDFYPILLDNYKIFMENISLVIDKMTKLNDYVLENVLEDYFSIYKNTGSEMGYVYHELSSISENQN